MKKQWLLFMPLMLGFLPGCFPKPGDILYSSKGLTQAEVVELTEALDTSNDFTVVFSEPGVTLHSNQVDYVQEIDLSQGASVQLLHGDIKNIRRGKGAYGGKDPLLARESLEKAWDKFSRTNENALCITNGQFFRNDDKASTGLAFPVKANGKILSEGYAGESEYPDEQLMLAIDSDRASIQTFDLREFYSSEAANIIGGLKPDADKGLNDETGRTFIGIKDSNGDGISETLLIFSSQTATQFHAAEVLRYFGASEVIMLDGGGSTQLLCQDTTYISSPRTIPQTIGVLHSQ